MGGWKTEAGDRDPERRGQGPERGAQTQREGDGETQRKGDRDPDREGQRPRVWGEGGQILLPSYFSLRTHLYYPVRD